MTASHLHQTRCQTCSLSSLCLPLSLSLDDVEQFDTIVRRRAPLTRGETLYMQGEAFENVYAVRSGSLKQTIIDTDGEEQIASFYLPGELVGLDSIDSAVHPGFLTALERTTVCEIPFKRLESLSEHLPELRHQLYRCMSREIVDDRRLMRLLSSKSADERLASFFHNLSIRFDRCGHSAERFRLPMSRSDIGTYLGLAIETISRVLGRFQQQGLLNIQGRHVEILDMAALKKHAGIIASCCNERRRA